MANTPPLNKISPNQLHWLGSDELYLDPKNPRLADKEFALREQENILQFLWENMAVDELVESIRTNGYWSHEELFAVRESGKLVVIEGNRRLAAVKLLLHPELRQAVGATAIPPTPPHIKKDLATLPVYVTTRREVWQYLGFKHVNGPQDWDSIAKAEYIARVRNDLGIELDDIAQTIGDRHNTVKRLYRGLMVLQQAENAGVFHREDRWAPRFAYSHLWTGLNYPNIQSYIGLTSEKGYKPDPIPKSKMRELGDLCVWLYGSKSSRQPPAIKSQNPDLRKLEEVLSTNRGISAMRAKYPLDIALNISRGDERLFREAVVKAEQSLKEAMGLFLSGFHGEEDLFNSAKTIRDLAVSLYEEMGEKLDSFKHPKKKRSGK